MPQRVGAREVATMTGLSMRMIQRRAREIPGVARLLGIYTFDAEEIRRWAEAGAPLPDVPISEAEIIARDLQPRLLSPWRASCRVYFIQDGGMIKIGISLNPNSRLSQLQRSAARPLTLLGHIAGDRDLEQAIHEKFKRQRVRGEWFKATRAVRTFVAEAIAYAAAANPG